MKLITGASIFPILILFAAALFAQERRFTVEAVDGNGDLVPNAVVRVIGQGGRVTPCVAEWPVYSCPVAINPGDRIEIRAEGFENFKRTITKYDITSGVFRADLSVGPIETYSNPITITRTEATIGETPESIATLARQEINVTSAPTLDDALRQVPGFSTFRRSGSRNANPTTQGVSLRGAGASGASRSIVLFDGVPLNDPFGGWVQWNRVSPIAIEAVEVLRGGASSLYGNSSLSGAIGLLSRRAAERFAVSAEVFGGMQKTLSGSLFTGGKYRGWSTDIAAGHFQTRGFIPVDEAERGEIDSFAGVRSTNLSIRIGRDLGNTVNIFFRPSYFGESRTNGTPAQINRTHSRQFVFGGNVRREPLSAEWRAFGGTQVYGQTFSAVSANRTTETLTRVQRSPAQSFGFSGQLSASFGSHSLAGGIEGREVRGAGDEVGFVAGAPTSLFGSGGRERTFGVFVRDVVSVGERIILTGGLRFDAWKNFRGLSSTRVLQTGITQTDTFPDREENAVSPHGAVRYRLNGRVAFHAAASHSFRAPTLNELYRGFRVGNVVTNANPDLRAERAHNFEGGASFRHGQTGIRASVFRSDIRRAIANVTLSSTPTLITRQRQNAGRIRTAGFEIDAETRIEKLRLKAGYLFADSRVAEFPSNPSLVKTLVPQVARHQFTFQAGYSAGTWELGAQGRASGAQFDDDLNLFRLEPYFQLDVFVSKKLREKLSVFAAVENVFNTRYSVGRTPVRTLNSPINARIGIRWN